jgi:hypothetical protein
MLAAVPAAYFHASSYQTSRLSKSKPIIFFPRKNHVLAWKSPVITDLILASSIDH